MHQTYESRELRVLIVEDSEHDTEILLRSLRRSGFTPTATVVGTEGEFRNAIDEAPEIILADFTLPGFGALRALEILEERKLDIPLIVVTGTAREEEVVASMRLGAADYLLKDRLARLSDAVTQAVNARQMRVEQRRKEAELAEAREQAQRDYDMLLGRLGVLAEQVGLASDQASIYRALFVFCCQQTPADGIFVCSYDDLGEQRRCVFSMNLVQGRFEQRDVTELPLLPLNDSPQSRAIRSGQVVLTNELPEALSGIATFDVGGDEVDNRPSLSSAAVPLKVLGRTIGVFEVQSTEPHAFGEQHVVALSMAANYAAVALENVGLLERERELRREAEESERRYRELVEQASDAIVVYDREGNLLQANSTAYRMMGSTGEGALAKVTDFISGEELEERPLRFLQLEPGATVLTERRFRRADGTELPVEINTRRISQDTFQSIVRDVSERKAVEEALLNEKSFSDTLINSLPGLFYLIDEDMRLIRWNQNLNSLTGLSDTEIMRMSPFDFFPESQHRTLQEDFGKVLAEGHSIMETSLLGEDGGEVPYVFSSTSVKLDGRNFVVGTGIDVSSQKQAEDRERELNLELEKRLNRLSSLHEIDMAITGSVDLRLTLEVVMDKVMRDLGVAATAVWIFEKSTQTFSCAASRGLPEREIRRRNPRLGEGTLGRCGLDRQMVRLQGERIGEAVPLATGSSRYGDYIALPLISKGRLQGVLEAYAPAGGALDEDRLEFLQALALQTAIAIDNVMMFQGLERSTIDLRLAYDATIEGWARALDLRDHETEGHSRRVTELTIRLARHIGVREEEMAHIRRGALLHDIGKLGVPDAILTKPAQLTEEERRIMQRHARLGYELLAPIAFLRPAADIPYCHHEAWDGSGYPRGLRGEEIPLAARIFAVADVYDALTSDRPYRRAWDPAKVRDYVRERSGSQFDPRVVEAFMELAVIAGKPGPAASERG
ncbi:MAG TPA: HD domain-containing phosphohydrolase [Trueperaceae bacterium]